MNIEVQAGSGFEAPFDADFTIRLASPFNESELSGTPSLIMKCTGPNEEVIELEGVAEGTDILWDVAAQTFTPGFWELNPKAVVAGHKRGFALAIGMNVLADGVSRWPASGGAVFPFQ